ncbi:MAG: FAD-binding oxidoreductase [Gammaproteobacteria bacterium]
MLWRHCPIPLPDQGGFHPFGNGRSYGDVCLSDGGVLVDTRPMNRFIGMDGESGILRCESGVLLSEVLDLIVPLGWFLPVVPGTQFVTVGGAVANDVHGKNHHRAGTFGCHVRALGLTRSNGEQLECSPMVNADLFAATIGGLGLTGVITWVEIQLKSIRSPFIQEETIRFRNIDEFFEISKASDEGYEYTVAWVDCLKKGSSLGRGLFKRANHFAGPDAKHGKLSGAKLAMPIDPPFPLVNKLSVKLMNSVYYRRQRGKSRTETVGYENFFFPLDNMKGWNRIYGPKGFVQYQFVVPYENGYETIKDILGAIAVFGAGSFLAVLKIFGEIQSPGLLSFPRPGVTLALDFPANDKVLDLLDSLDELTRAAGGAVYPAKDARMSGYNFTNYYPQWEEMLEFVDPASRSHFWRRVTDLRS